MSRKPIAELLDDNRLIIWSKADARNVYNKGFYGKPLGIPRPTEDFDAPLLLDPVEALYLLEENLIYIQRKGDIITKKAFNIIQMESFANFKDKFTVYKQLRKKGFVSTPGLKYGCDFAVYDDGPGKDHAPYVMQIMSEADNLSAIEIVKAGRLASTVRKAFIIAIVNGENVRFIEFNWWRA